MATCPSNKTEKLIKFMKDIRQSLSKLCAKAYHIFLVFLLFMGIGVLLVYAFSIFAYKDRGLPLITNYTAEFQNELTQICAVPNGEYIENMKFLFSDPSDARFEFDFTGYTLADEELFSLMSDLTQKIDEIFTLQLMNEHELRLIISYVRIHLNINQELYILAHRRTNYNDAYNLEGIEWEIKKIDRKDAS